MQRGEFVAAIDSYTDALKLEPDSPLFAHRGWAYFFADAWQPALRDFDEAVRRSPDSDEALIGRGLCRVMLGKLTEAIADAEAAFAHEIAAPEMMHNIACIFALAAERLEMGQAPDSEVASRRRQKAMDAIDKTLSLVPESERAAFWRDKIRCDRALNSVRSLAAFKQLEQRYLGDAARPTTEKSGREK